MVDERGRRARRSMSLSPKLNPLDAFIGIASDEEGDLDEAVVEGQAGLTNGRGNSSSSNGNGNGNGNDIVPHQRPSIINEKAIVRYYYDISKTPVIISTGQQGTIKTVSLVGNTDEEPGHLDVALRLDMTTGCGGKVWPAAEVLGQYIAGRRNDGQWHGKTIVELGSGTGLVGLLAAQLEGVKHVYITDQIAMMKLMHENLALNPRLKEKVAVEELNWGESVPSTVPHYPDVLLLADCVYLEVAFQPLVDTMFEMATAETEILFCYQQRRKADKRFFKMLRRHFTFHDIDDDDQERRMQYNRQGTHLYRVVKKARHA